MHNESRIRIAWFLRLQRILSFPGSFLAPRASPLRRLRTASDDFVSDRPTQPPLMAAAHIPSPTRIDPLRHQRNRTFFAPNALPGSTFARPIASPPVKSIIRHLRYRDLPQSAKNSISMAAILQTGIPAVANPTREACHGPQQRQRGCLHGGHS